MLVFYPASVIFANHATRYTLATTIQVPYAIRNTLMYTQKANTTIFFFATSAY